MKGPTKQLQDVINWGAFDRASHAPQLSLATINCYIQTQTAIHMHTYYYNNIMLGKCDYVQRFPLFHTEGEPGISRP